MPHESSVIWKVSQIEHTMSDPDSSEWARFSIHINDATLSMPIAHDSQSSLEIIFTYLGICIWTRI